MQMAAPPTPRKSYSTARALLRWILVLSFSIFLHWIFITWGTDSFKLQPTSQMNVQQLQTILLTPPQPPLVEPIKANSHPTKARSKPAPKKASTAIKGDSARASMLAPSKPLARTMSAGDIAAARASVADLSPASALPDQTASSAETSDENRYIVDLPPSAELQYDVQKTGKNDESVYGHGTIKWSKNGARYSIDGDAGVLFFTVLTFKSSGHINDDGIVPDIYQEKRFRKKETSTHFHANQNTIHFSYNDNTLPRIGIEQDRISVIWQLAGIGRGGSKSFSPGREIDLLVAGTRNVSMWRMQIINQEEIMINGEAIFAWHITRIPKMGAHEQKLDLWLAPQKDWYPVRLRYTEDNGDFLDMTLNNLTPAKVSSTALQY